MSITDKLKDQLKESLQINLEKESAFYHFCGQLGLIAVSIENISWFSGKKTKELFNEFENTELYDVYPIHREWLKRVISQQNDIFGVGKKKKKSFVDCLKDKPSEPFNRVLLEEKEVEKKDKTKYSIKVTFPDSKKYVPLEISEVALDLRNKIRLLAISQKNHDIVENKNSIKAKFNSKEDSDKFKFQIKNLVKEINSKIVDEEDGLWVAEQKKIDLKESTRKKKIAKKESPSQDYSEDIEDAINQMYKERDRW